MNNSKEDNIYKKIVNNVIDKTPANIEPLFKLVLINKISERINKKKEELLGR